MTTRQVADSLRAAADRVEQLSSHIPDPAVRAYGEGVHVEWRDASEQLGRDVIAELGGDWSPSESFMYRTDEGPVTMWWISFAKVKPVSAVNPAELLAEVTS